jgi:polyphosphate kinase 2 (PPK2 family)
LTKPKTESFRVGPDAEVKLRDWPTRVKSVYASEADYQSILSSHIAKLSSLQNLLYADNRYAILLIFQAMDAAGKDGAIRHVMSGVNPQGCQVFSFKHPSAQELEHDFLWRTTRALPERGRLEDQKLWEHRFKSILGLEKHLHRNGTRIVKFFLHLSKDEQRKRFLARIDDPEKQWKLSQADLDERRLWKDYRKAYEACLSATSTAEAPWYAVPADDKKNARLIISQVLVELLESLDLAYPEASVNRKDLARMRRELEGDSS